MKNFLVKTKEWFKNHLPTKRRLIQLYAALLTNANIKGFATGKIYMGSTKTACVPGLNCYSCPGAIGACPLGALQDSLAASSTRAPAYIFGILILFGLLLGRVICGFLCPFGLIQELLYKIRSPKLRKNRFTRILSYFKYVLLGILIAIPVIYAGIPSFCKYVCPAGTLEGAVSLLANIENSDFYAMLGYLFTWKFAILVVVVVACVFIYRAFCRFICPLGAIYGLFCRLSLLGVKLDKNKCIDCGLCIEGCKMDIKHVGDHECIQCGECIPVCPVQAITWKGSKIFVKNTLPVAQPAAAEGGKVDLLSLSKSNAAVVVTTPVKDSAEVCAAPVVGAEGATASGAEISADVPSEGTLSEAAKPSKFKAAIKAFGAKFKNRRFALEFTAWVLAIAVLITALVCYNYPEKVETTLSPMTFTTYRSAASDSGESYMTDYADNKMDVLYFWRTDLEESVNGIAELIVQKEKYGANVNILAIHSIYKDNRDVQAFIDEKGWTDSGIIFAQDDSSVNAYSHFGGDISVPSTITVVVGKNAAIISQDTGTDGIEKLGESLAIAQSELVYGVGDQIPAFDLKLYKSQSTATQFTNKSILGKVTVINYWYTDCDPCKAELPYFESIYEEYDGAINMFAVHSYSAVPSGGVQAWLDGNVDRNGRAWNSYEITFAQDTEETCTYLMFGGKYAYPMTVVLDANGVIDFVKQGACSETELREAIVAAMNLAERLGRTLQKPLS